MERLRDPGAQFDFPGDRFIPTRSLMNLDLAQCLLTGEKETVKPDSPPVSFAKEEYRRRLVENLTLDSEGKPFRMLVFKGSPRKTPGRRLLLVDEMMHGDQDRCRTARPIRTLPTSPDRILDAPDLLDDYYLNLMDWGKNNILAVALGTRVYLWNAANGNIQELLRTDDEEVYPTSVAWSGDGEKVAVGFIDSRVELWDAASARQVRNLKGHRGRVGSLSWNHHLLTSGSMDTSIINHDVRARASSGSRFKAHSLEVCGLRWSGGGNQLASGGNDNLVYIWEARGSSKYLHRFDEHSAAVRALAWCPFQSNILASGGGTGDRCMKFWNTRTGKCTCSVNTGAQVCALEWNMHQKEILSAHGFSQNQLCLWRYPSMTKIGELQGHKARVLHLSQSPDGSTVVSAAADETLRFWKVFGPPRPKSSSTETSSLFSMGRSQIR